MTRHGPVVVLSYAYSGAERVQGALAAGSDLACTSGTGILPLCTAAAESWLRVEARNGRAMSKLAVVTVRNLVTAQVTTILASADGTRWCELSTAPAGVVDPFLQVFPNAQFVCVHRSCLDVIRVGLRANPWGMQGQAMVPYLLRYPGNNVAAMAAYWVGSTEQLLAFEDANGEITHRVRYEDVDADAAEALTAVRTFLQLENLPHDDIPVGPPNGDGPGAMPPLPEAEVPAEMIPEPLRERITRLHARLGYPPLAVTASGGHLARLA